jgi:hypothetical protein
MKHASSRLLFSYWDSLRGDRAAPNREEIDPARIRHILADTFILGLEPDGSAVFRLAGTRVCALFGRDLKNVPLDTVVSMAGRGQAAELLELVANEGAGAVAGLVGTSDLGSVIGLELLVLPLSPRASEDRRAIGALSPSSVPSWLGLTPIQTLELRSLRAIHPVEKSGLERAEPGTAVVSGRDRFVVLEGGRSH